MAPQLVVRLSAKSKDAESLPAPQTPADPSTLNTVEYGDLLPGSDSDHLLAADCPFSHLIGENIIVIYDSSSKAPDNPRASRLTTNVESGEEVPIKGDALVLYNHRGKNMGVKDWEALDNCIYDELLEYFGQGLKPNKTDLQRLVQEYKTGKFDYSQIEGEEDDDRNKDDGSALPGWG